MPKKKRLSLFEVLEETRQPIEVGSQERIDRAIGELAFTGYWKALKSRIRDRIKAILVQADDIDRLKKGEINVEEFGVLTLVARMSAGHLQDIIDLVEASGKWLEKVKQEEAAKKRKGVRRRG